MRCWWGRFEQFQLQRFPHDWPAPLAMPGRRRTSTTPAAPAAVVPAGAAAPVAPVVTFVSPSPERAAAKPAAKPRAKRVPRTNKRNSASALPVATAAPVEAPLVRAAADPAPVVTPMDAKPMVDSQASTVPGEVLAPVVQHEVVMSPQKRARSVSRGLGLTHESAKFHDLAKEGLRHVRRDLKNRCFFYPLPLSGDVGCVFKGKADGSAEILTNDVVRFEWSYTCDVGNGVGVQGSVLSQNRVRELIYGKVPPRMPRNMMDASCMAKIYERLFEQPSLASFISKHRSGEAAAACRVLRICYPKPAQTLPRTDSFVDSSGTSAKWIVCAEAGPGKAICHPGPTNMHSDNRLTHKHSELRVPCEGRGR